MKKIDLSTITFKDSFDHQKAVLFDKADFGAPVKTQILLVKPGQYIPPHHHNVRTEALMIFEGEGEIVVAGEKIVSPQETIICQPGDIHAMRNVSTEKPLKILVIRTNDPGKEDMIWEKAL